MFDKQLQRAERLAKEHGSLIIPPVDTPAAQLWLPPAKPASRKEYMLEFFAYETVYAPQTPDECAAIKAMIAKQEREEIEHAWNRLTDPRN